jgi:hypothetical protein
MTGYVGLDVFLKSTSNCVVDAHKLTGTTNAGQQIRQRRLLFTPAARCVPVSAAIMADL